MPNKRIVITGIGPISSLGIGKDNFWQSLIQAKTNIKKEEIIIEDEPWGSYPVHKDDKNLCLNFN